MDVLQEARPELSHSALSAVVDAAAGWIEQQRDNRAVDLLNTVVPDAGTAAYFALLGRPTPQQLIVPSPR